ncbi:MAG: DUF349 domain-containing protein [Bacteroidales bacterium]|nr:DUF349 domain-containing protein [Bacteroidales bacterium]
MENKAELDQNPEMTQTPEENTGPEGQTEKEEVNESVTSEVKTDESLPTETEAAGEESKTGEEEPQPPSAEAPEATSPRKRGRPRQKTDEPSAEAPQDDHDDDSGADDDPDYHEEDKPAAKEEFYSDKSREELLVLLDELLQGGEVDPIKAQVAQIKMAYLRKTRELQKKLKNEFVDAGGAPDAFVAEPDPTDSRFEELFVVYRSMRQKHLEELEEQKKKNLEAKKLILEELKALIDSEETLKKTYDEFRELQDRWKKIGVIPRNEVNNLWQSYHFFVEKFFDKVKINKELRDLDLRKNLEAKMALCEKAEELLIENSIIKSFKELQRLHEEWKEIGPAPEDKKDEIWERFRAATEKINQRRREHYIQLAEEQKGNLTAKTELCERAEEILRTEERTLKLWQEDTQKMSELLKIWRSIGPAPRKYNDGVWTRFKNSLDAFFTVKKEYFNEIKDEQLNNYNRKLDLCIQAEGMKDSADWKKTSRDFITLQQEWKSIGPVPRKHSDKIWKRFRAACDEFFNRKSEYFGNVEKNEQENLKIKEDLISKVREYEFGSDKNENLNVLKDFQRQWMEVGHVPIAEKERLQNEFRETVNTRLDKLKISHTEIQTMSFRNRYDNIKEQPNARRIMSNEKNFLISKKKQLEDDVMLWENNLGFLAKSKQAALLKAEFEKKIEKTREEIGVLAAKIKILDEEARS